MHKIMQDWEKENKDLITGWTVEWGIKPFTKIITYNYVTTDTEKRKMIFELDLT